MEHWMEFPTDNVREPKRNAYINLSNVCCVFPKYNELTATIFQFQDSDNYIIIDMPYDQVVDKIKHST